MKPDKRILTILFIVLAVSNVMAESAEKWEPALNKDGIQVFTREIAGSDFYEFMGITIIDARIEVLEEIIKDVASHNDWIADRKESVVVKTIDNTKMVIYSVTKAPWPVSNREALVISEKHTNYKSGIVTFDINATDEPKVPVKQGNVRITELKAQWVLTYISRERTKVIYTMRSNPGGNIPKTIANMSSRNFPYRTLLGMKKMATRDTFLAAARASETGKEIEKCIAAGILKQ